MRRLVLSLVCLVSLMGVARADFRPTNQVVVGYKLMTASGPIPATDTIINCDATNGAVTYTLPPSKASLDYVTVVKIDSTANACTPAASGSDTITNSGTAALTVKGANVTLYDATPGSWTAITPVATSGSNYSLSGRGLIGVASVTANSDTSAEHDVSNFSLDDEVNVYDPKYGAYGDGVHNDWPAVEAAVQAACPSGACTKWVHLPPGNYLFSSTASGAPFALTTATLGSASGCVVGLKLVGDGGRQSYAYSQVNGLTKITIHDTSASLGLDMTGNGEWVFRGIDLENATGDSAGPKALLGVGKTSTCDADVGVIEDSTIESWAGTGTYALFDYGAENLTILNSEIQAHGPNLGVTASGSAIDYSSINTAAITTSTTLKTAPVSSTIFDVLGGNSAIVANGVTGTPAYGVFLDEGQSGGTTYNTMAQMVFDNYWRLTGPADIGIGDGFTGTPSNTYQYTGLHVNGRVELTYAGANTEQFIALGNRLDAPEIYAQISENTASSSPLIQDTQSIIGGTVFAIGPNSGTCINTPSAKGSHLFSTTGCTTTNSGADAAEVATDNTDPILRANTLTMSGVIGLQSITFASLPASCTPGQVLYVSDAKNVADGVTMASTCVGSGTGSVAVCKASNTWKCGQ